MSSLFSTYLWSGSGYAESLALASVEPVTGSSVGGIPFIVTGDALNPVKWDSIFIGTSLEAGKFVDTSSGGGSVVTGAPHLKLITGSTAGASAQVQTVHSWADTQAEVEVLVPRVTNYPASEVTVFELTLRVDASNFTTFGVYLGPASDSLVLRAHSSLGGSQVFVQEQAIFAGSSKFKILRWGTALIFVYNGVIFAVSEKFVSTSAKFELTAANKSAAYNLETKVSYFKYRPFVVFGGEPVHDTIAVSQKRLRGVVPASKDSKGVVAAYAGLVNVAAVGDGTVVKTDVFTYTFDSGLVLVSDRSSGIKLSIVGDDVLRTPEGVVRGLGENR